MDRKLKGAMMELVDLIGQCVRKIEMALVNSSELNGKGPRYDAARAAIDQLQADLSPQPITPPHHRALADVLDVRTANALDSIGLATVGDLLSTPVEKLRLIPNIGCVTLGEIYRVLVSLRLGHLLAALKIQEASRQSPSERAKRP